MKKYVIVISIIAVLVLAISLLIYRFSKTRVERIYFKNGNLQSETFHVTDRPITFFEWYENGCFKQELHFSEKSGEQEGVEKYFFENGRIKISGLVLGYSFVPDSTVHDGAMLKIANGTWTHYFVNGNIEVRFSNKNGYRDGTYEKYFENGRLKIYAFYVQGTLRGNYREFDDNGVLIQDKTFP